MKIIIDIPEEYYKVIMEIPVNLSTLDMLIIRNGKPLPKGHGRLIDVDLLRNQFPIWIDNFSSYVVNNTISNAPTIIEADKAESEDVR